MNALTENPVVLTSVALAVPDVILGLTVMTNTG